ncbi:MAG TPA: hypothetical protein VLK88_17090 [Gemmatimonadales bacterium]|nr:hypothetical protein [Gemmatimonadales bacterium]
MFGSTILDVAIGMIFVYLLISLICSALNEYIESKLKNRSKDLEKGIANLLGDPQLVKDLYQHPLVKALYSGTDLPSYIPAQTFSLALWNLATYAQEGKDTAVAVTRSLPEIRKVVSQMQNSDLKRALLTLMDEAGTDLERARVNVERWYDDAMDRVSGWYKRRTQWILLMLGLAFAVALNIDSIRIADRLYLDTPTRNAIAAAAEGYAAAARTSGTVSKEQIDANFNRINHLGLPLGWDLKEIKQGNRTTGEWLGAMVLKLLGLILTGLAVSLGAPFWFDLLNKFMVVRSTIKPREKSEETPSKDKQKAETPAPAGPDADAPAAA